MSAAPRRGRILTEYGFYPYETTADNFAQFGPRDLRPRMHDLLRNRDTRDAVLPSPAGLAEFFRHYCQTDMELSENIPSKEEHHKALQGQRHYRDTEFDGAVHA